MPHDLSVIISFYRNWDFLQLVLAGLERQSQRHFEVLIADDGSPPEVVERILDYARTSPFPLRHVWHEDDGWRKNLILNQAVRKSSSDYLLFLDGDCIPHRRALATHLRRRDAGTALSGRRVNLSQSWTEQLSPDDIRRGSHESRLRLIRDAWRGGRHTTKGLRLPVPKIAGSGNRRAVGISGCHWSAWKSDLQAVNGFDNQYRAPGVGEDTDIEHRLRKSGVQIRSVKFEAVLYHLWHPRLERVSASENANLLAEAHRRSDPACADGLRQAQAQDCDER